MCWSSKKQNYISSSSTEAEYIAATSCFSQLLWMKQCLKDFGIEIKTLPLFCDNESAIKLLTIRCSMARQSILRYGIISSVIMWPMGISLSYVNTKDQLADIFTKALDEKRFKELRGELNVIYAGNFS